MTEPDDALAPRRTLPAYTLFLLFLSNLFNIADRTLLGIVIEPVKADLGLSDTQMSLVSGSAFVLFNLIVGIFIARFVDRGDRKRILVVGIALWSAATALTGTAQGFASLALMRVLVGVGEATVYPVAVSLIADLFVAERRPRAVGIFQASTFFGVVIGATAAGILAAAHGWRSMFLICGAAGFALVALTALTMREPGRRADGGAGRRGDASGSLRDSVRVLLAQRAFVPLSVGAAIGSMTAMALSAWAPTFLLRSHGVPLARVGAMIGPAVGIGGVAGSIFAGMLASRFARRQGSEIHGIRVPLILLPLAVPVWLLFCFAEPLGVTLAAVGVLNFLLSSLVGPCLAAAIRIAPQDARAVSSTLMLAASGLIGGALAPLIVGMLSDALAPTFGHGSLRFAMATMMLPPLVAWPILWLALRRAAVSLE